MIILSVMYVATQMLSDITSLKIISLFGWSMDAGTLIYPITFTLRDLVHKVAGLRVARLLIFLAAGINLFMAGLFWLVSILPPDLSVGKPNLMVYRFSVLRLFIIAEVIAELMDKSRNQVKERPLAMGSLSSTDHASGFLLFVMPFGCFSSHVIFCHECFY